MLKLSCQLIDAGKRYYRLVYEKNRTRGRKMREVASACLYIACRVDGAPYMLMDFQEVSRVNVYRIGHSFIDFTRTLFLNLPHVDPSLFIPRFCSKLNINSNTRDVTETAYRILNAMDRDWMTTGKRPNGICAAALLISARCYGFDTTSA